MKIIYTFLENLGAATIIFNDDSVVTACNRASETLLDQVSGSLVGSRLSELGLYFIGVDGHPEETDGFPVNKIEPCRQDAVHFDFGIRFPLLDRTRWFRGTLKPNFTKSGMLAELVLTLVEITEIITNKTTHDQVALAKKEWETTVDALQDIVTILDTEMRIVRANKMAHDLSGYALGDLKGRTCFEVFHNRAEPCEGCPVRLTIKDHLPRTGTVYNEVLQKTFSLSSFPLFDKHGNIQQLVQVARDITEYLRTASEKDRLMAAIEQGSESVVIASNNKIIQYVNPAFELASGYSRTDVVGKGLTILRSGKHDRRFYESIWETVKDQKTWRGRMTNKRKNGTSFTEDMTISSVLDSSGEVVNYVSLARDVTREEALEQQLQQAMKMEALGTLAGGIAHDFNNILAAMIGWGEIARDHLSQDHPARKDIEQVIASGDRAAGLVNQILTFGRKESYGHFQLVALQQIIAEATKLLRPSLPATIDLRSEVDDTCPSVFADPGQIYQVLMNLCTNARQSIGDDHGRITIKLSMVKATDKHGGTTISSTGSGGILELEIRDTGCGIEEEILDKIFDPFFTTKKKERGTGLGLAVVHGIIKKHKGEIQVSSKVGIGTTVRVYLAADGREVKPSPDKRAFAIGGHERIMVVDDEPALARMLQKMLQKAGYDVTTYNDSIAAVHQFRQDPNCCDLVITDMIMPDMTGAELARECLALRSDIPIIVITGHSEKFDRNRLTQIGIKELALKPVKKEELYQIVRRVLENGKNINH